MGEFDSGASNSSHGELNAAIWELMRRQSGNVSRRQLLAAGLGNGAIQYRLRAGTLLKRHDGVYCQAPARQDPQALIAAAVLAGGPDAVASHTSAGWLWGFLARYERPAEISLPTGDRRPRHVISHRCPSLQPRDLTHQHGVPTTTPARTALDLAPGLTTQQLTRLVNDQLRADGHLRPAALQDIIDRNPRHPGAQRLRPFADSPTNPTESPFEDDFLAFVATYGLPTPAMNFPCNGRRLDAFFPDHGVIVELDGWDSHRQRDAFEDDRERDAEHLRLRLITVRITKARLKRQPDYEAQRLREILSGRGPMPLTH